MNNVTVTVERKTREASFDETEQWSDVETITGRIWSLSGTEIATYAAVDKTASHRLYTLRTTASESDRMRVDDGPYAGLYLIRFVDAKIAPGMSHYQVDLFYHSALQEGNE